MLNIIVFVDDTLVFNRSYPKIVKIGTLPSSTVRITAPGVGPMHAVLEEHEDGVKLIVLDRRWPVIANDVTLDGVHVVADGSRLRIGNAELVVSRQAASDTPAPVKSAIVLAAERINALAPPHYGVAPVTATSIGVWIGHPPGPDHSRVMVLSCEGPERVATIAVTLWKMHADQLEARAREAGVLTVINNATPTLTREDLSEVAVPPGWRLSWAPDGLALATKTNNAGIGLSRRGPAEAVASAWKLESDEAALLAKNRITALEDQVTRLKTTLRSVDADAQRYIEAMRLLGFDGPDVMAWAQRRSVRVNRAMAERKALLDVLSPRMSKLNARDSDRPPLTLLDAVKGLLADAETMATAYQDEKLKQGPCATCRAERDVAIAVAARAEAELAWYADMRSRTDGMPAARAELANMKFTMRAVRTESAGQKTTLRVTIDGLEWSAEVDGPFSAYPNDMTIRPTKDVDLAKAFSAPINEIKRRDLTEIMGQDPPDSATRPLIDGPVPVRFDGRAKMTERAERERWVGISWASKKGRAKTVTAALTYEVPGAPSNVKIIRVPIGTLSPKVWKAVKRGVASFHMPGGEVIRGWLRGRQENADHDLLFVLV